MVPEPDLLRWLQEWYLRQCDGDWEHQSGIEIGTLDNPGWFIRIDLVDTELEDQPFADVTRDVTRITGCVAVSAMAALKDMEDHAT